MCGVKKKLALGIAGVSAALIAGWQIIQSESESGFSDPSSDPGPGPVTSAGAANGGPESAGTDAEVPDEASKAELYEIAQDMKIRGRSKMSKTELRRAIEAEG